MSLVDLPQPITINPPTGGSSLPIVELDRSAVITRHKRIRSKRNSKKRDEQDCSFGNFIDTLEFSAWSFFHAAKKTELTRSFTRNDAQRAGLCFAHEYQDLLVWNTGNLRRVDRSVFALEDFSQSGLAGRLGEATAYLTMLKLGYVYWDRISVLWERAAFKLRMSHEERIRRARVLQSRLSKRPDLEPDFAFEKENHDVALMEAKGSFVSPIEDAPSVKDDLKHALDQLESWSKMITPTPQKYYGIGTYFRDLSDTSGDPSLIALVDPPGKQPDIEAIDFPDDWIRRGNYGSWLIGMGLGESGFALQQGLRIDVPSRRLVTLAIGGKSYLVRLGRGRFAGSDLVNLPLGVIWLSRFYPVDIPLLLQDFGIDRVGIMGVEVETARLIEKSLHDPESYVLMRREEITQGGRQASKEMDGFYGSIFPDGTIFGEVNLASLDNMRVEEFWL